MVPARDRAVTRPLGGFSQQRRCRYLISRSCSNLQEHSSSIAAERTVIRVDRDRQICVLYVELEQQLVRRIGEEVVNGFLVVYPRYRGQFSVAALCRCCRPAPATVQDSLSAPLLRYADTPGMAVPVQQ